MPSGYVPPSARTEEIGQITTPSKQLYCEEIKIEGERSVVVLRGLLMRKAAVKTQAVKSVVVYFQGMVL